MLYLLSTNTLYRGFASILSAVEDQVRMRLSQLLDAFNARDLHQAVSFYTEDSKWLPPGVDSLDGRDGM